MKLRSKLCALLFPVILSGCHTSQPEKIYKPRLAVHQEAYDYYPKSGASPLSIGNFEDKDSLSKDPHESPRFIARFRDTTIHIQMDASGKGNIATNFDFAQFLNTQKTVLLVQVADRSGLVAPFYLITLKDDHLDVVSLYRPSNGKNDVKFTKGLVKIGRSAYLINNDYVVTTVNTKLYPIKREHENERIQGLFFVTSADKKTLGFMVASGLYQVHYPTGDIYMQPFASNAPKDPSQLYPWIQHNYSWQQKADGASFLKSDKDDNRIVDIREFKKS